MLEGDFPSLAVPQSRPLSPGEVLKLPSVMSEYDPVESPLIRCVCKDHACILLHASHSNT